MQPFVRAILISLLSLAMHTSAESQVCIGGDLDHLTETQKSGCRYNADLVDNDATKFHAPNNWHFFILCTESDWKVYAAFSKHSAADLALLGADTDLENRTTFFRGEWLQTANTAHLEMMVAHEVASALLQTADETIIQKQVVLWIPEAENKTFTLRASR